MNIIRTLVLRDMRRFLPWVAVLMMATFCIYTFSSHPSMETSNVLRWLMATIPGAMWVLFLLSIVQETPPTGSSEFWMTRPISGTHLFAAKLASVLMLCVVPPPLTLALARMSGVVARAWFIDNTNAGVIISNFSQTLLTILIVMLLAVLTRNIRQFLIALVLALTVFTVSILNIPGASQFVLRQHTGCFEWAFKIPAILGLLFIIHYQYKHRRRIVTTGLAVLLVLILSGIYIVWPSVPRATHPPAMRPGAAESRSQT